MHARYGSKDAILDAFFEHGYVQRVLPGPQPGATGMANAVAHFGRIQELYADDPEFLRAMFVMTFEAVKTTSPVRSRLQTWFERGVEAIEPDCETESSTARCGRISIWSMRSMTSARRPSAWRSIGSCSANAMTSSEPTYARARAIRDYGSKREPTRTRKDRHG